MSEVLLIIDTHTHVVSADEERYPLPYGAKTPLTV
jgi:hypothetical protein